MHAASDLERFLDDLARGARPGDRLPPIRDLMRRFGASQMVVQRALKTLSERGLIESQVGRGTYFRGTPDEADRPAPVALPGRRTEGRSILLLRRSISINRGRVLMEGLHRRFSDEGHRVLELSYTDPDHAQAILKGLPRFDVCVLQSTFKIVTIRLLAALRDKCDMLAVDGAALVGTDVESVGMEWGNPLAAAVAMLQGLGHRRIAYATTAHPFLATQLGWRRFEQLRETLAGVELEAITVPRLPGDDYESALAEAIGQLRGSTGRPPFTALIAWGIEDGARLRALLSQLGAAAPAQLSVVLLGRTDLSNEHADFFDTFGCRVADQMEALHAAITARWADPTRPYGLQLIPMTSRAGESCAAAPSRHHPVSAATAAPPPAQRSKPRRLVRDGTA